MIDPGGQAPGCQQLVGARRQQLAPGLGQLGRVPGPLLGPEPRPAHHPHRQQHMAVRLEPPLPVRCPMVDVQVRDHAASDEHLLHQAAGQLDIVAQRQLLRQRELDLACQLGVFALLGCLDRVPQHRPLRQPFRSTGWQQDRRVHAVGLGAEVMGAAEPLVMQPAGCPVGGGRHDAAPLAAGDDLEVGVEDRHGRDPQAGPREHRHPRSIRRFRLASSDVAQQRISAPSLSPSTDAGAGLLPAERANPAWPSRLSILAGHSASSIQHGA